MEKKYFLLYMLALAMNTSYAANPATKEWVMQQISSSLQTLTSANWNAICSSGSASSSTGCYGNISSPAFMQLNNAIGGFTRYTNINPVSAPSSVFVKAFLGGTNIPVSTSTISVAISSTAGRCVLFTQNGLAIGPGGINTASPSNGTTTGAFPPPFAVIVLAINNGSDVVQYNNAPSAFPTTGGSPNSDPVYLLCAGYNPSDNTTAAAFNVTAT